jgi:hypothetical protein
MALRHLGQTVTSESLGNSREDVTDVVDLPRQNIGRQHALPRQALTATAETHSHASVPFNSLDAPLQHDLRPCDRSAAAAPASIPVQQPVRRVLTIGHELVIRVTVAGKYVNQRAKRLRWVSSSGAVFYFSPAMHERPKDRLGPPKT